MSGKLIHSELGTWNFGFHIELTSGNGLRKFPEIRGYPVRYELKFQQRLGYLYLWIAKKLKAKQNCFEKSVLSKEADV